MEIDKKKIKLLNRLFAVGYEDEKSIAAMTMDDILAWDGISIADISLINELQKAIKSNQVIAFFSGTEEEVDKGDGCKI